MVLLHDFFFCRVTHFPLNQVTSASSCLGWMNCQRCAPAEWNLCEIFRFSHRFWREILVKFSVAHPNPGKRRTENFTKISRQISRHLWQRKTEKNFTSALLQGSCSEWIVWKWNAISHVPRSAVFPWHFSPGQIWQKPASAPTGKSTWHLHDKSRRELIR